MNITTPKRYKVELICKYKPFADIPEITEIETLYELETRLKELASLKRYNFEIIIKEAEK